MSEGSVWECECGNIEYGLYPPKECAECESLNSYMKVPDEEVEEAEERHVIKKQRKQSKK